MSGCQGSVDIFAKDARGKTIFSVVGHSKMILGKHEINHRLDELDGFFIGLEFHYDTNWTEYLLSDYFHIWRCIAEDSGAVRRPS